MNILDKIENAVFGQECPICGSEKLYLLSDKRHKCGTCGLKYSPGKLKIDMKVLHYFSLEIPANKAAKDLGLSYKNVRTKYMGYRNEINLYLVNQFVFNTHISRSDYSHFGGTVIQGKTASEKNLNKVLALCEKSGIIFTAVADNIDADELIEEIKKIGDKGYLLSADKFKSFKSLKCFSNHLGDCHKVKGGNRRHNASHLEGFWSFAKERLLKYHGISRDNFFLYMKEMEFRFNYRKENLYHKLIKIHYCPEYTYIQNNDKSEWRVAI